MIEEEYHIKDDTIYFHEGVEELRGLYPDRYSIDYDSIKHKIVFPSTLIFIGQEDYCFGFKGDIIIPDSVVSIGNNAFANSEIRTLRLGKGLKTIGDNAFYNCKIDKIINDSNVEFIGQSAFPCPFELNYGIKCMFTNSIEGYDLKNAPKSLKAILDPSDLPKNTVSIHGEKYFTRSGANDKKPKVIFDKSLLTVQGTAIDLDLYDFSKNIVLSDELLYMGELTFYKGFSTIPFEIPDSVLYIAKDAFYEGYLSLEVSQKCIVVDEDYYVDVRRRPYTGEKKVNIDIEKLSNEKIESLRNNGLLEEQVQENEKKVISIPTQLTNELLNCFHEIIHSSEYDENIHLPIIENLIISGMDLNSKELTIDYLVQMKYYNTIIKLISYGYTLSDTEIVSLLFLEEYELLDLLFSIGYDIDKIYDLNKSFKFSEDPIYHEFKPNGTLLHLALICNNDRMISFLINHNASISVNNSLGQTPQELGEESCNENIKKLFDLDDEYDLDREMEEIRLLLQ